MTKEEAKSRIAGPNFVQYIPPVLDALKRPGWFWASCRSLRTRRRDTCFTERSAGRELTSGSSRFENQVAWARFYLVKAGYIDSSKRGVWALAEKGLSAGGMSHDRALQLFKSIHGEFGGKPTGSTPDPRESEAVSPDEAETGETLRANWRQNLIGLVQSLPPAGFERLLSTLAAGGRFRAGCRHGSIW